MGLQKQHLELGLAFSRARIIRLLVVVLTLTLLQIFPEPTNKYSLSQTANAANSLVIQTNLALNANATAGANDVGTQMDLVNNPVHTNTGVGYYTFGNTGVATGSQKYAYKNLNFADRANVSIFMWVYPTASGVILSHSGQVNPFTGYRLTTFNYTSAGKFEVGLYNNAPISTASTSLTTPLNNWYYLGLTYDGSTIRGYLNGQQFNTVAMNNWTTSGEDFFHIGTSQSSTCFSVACSDANAASFRMGEFMVYRSALSAAEVYSNFEATTKRFGPTIGNPSSQSTYVNKSTTFSIPSCTATTSGSSTCGYQWQLSTNGGASYSDISSATTFTYTTPALSVSSSGNRYRVITYDPGTGSPTSQRLFSVSEAALLTVSTPPGSDTDTALSFSGSSMYADVVDTAGSPFDTTGTFTLQAWVKPLTTCSAGGAVVSKRSYMLYCQDNVWKVMILANGVSGSGVATNIAVQPNEWHHIAITKSSLSGSVLFYYDGTLVETVLTGVTSMTPNDSPFEIGRYSALGFYFQGEIDEVRLYNSQRSQAQIVTDMHSYGSITNSELMAYYDCNEGANNAMLYNRKSGSSNATDLAIAGSPSWPDVKTVATSGPYTTVKFLRSYITAGGGWKAPQTVRSSILNVAGGGGGGSRHGGGGGGGGVSYAPTYALSAGATYEIKVGVGGIGYGQPGNSAYMSGSSFITSAGGANGTGTSGGNSTFRPSSVLESITAWGGGGGGGVGLSGGSGGGSHTSTSSGGESITVSTQFFTSYGNRGGVGYSGLQCGSDYCGGGGGGAGSVGGIPAVSGESATDRAGNGGDGFAIAIESLTLGYYGGGGGGGAFNAGLNSTGGSGGGGAGGKNAQGAHGTNGLGGGGGGGGFSGGTSYRGGNGGSGVVVIRWITANTPIFTAPIAIDTTTALTRYTFRTSGAASSPLTRNYQWQFSSNSGSTWTTQQASTSDSFTTTTLETTTSGITNRYRVIVTDSDTAGLSISDSRTSYLVINPRITITVDTSTITRDYGAATVKTFTFANGTGPRVATASPGNQTGITWSNLNSDSATLTLAPTLTAGSYSDTITVTDSVTATTSLRVTITINKARQASLSIGQYNAFVGVSTYPINVYGGSGTGAVTRSRLTAGSANCTLASGMFLAATSPGICSVQAVRAGDTNYLSETATATIYWIQWSDAYATRVPSTPTEIVLNHQTAITKYNYDTLTVTSYQNSSGVTITSIATGATLRIIGDGFSPTSAYTEVVFASMDALDLTSGLQVISSGGSNYLQLTVPSGVTTGAITVNSPKGTAVGPTLTITP